MIEVLRLSHRPFRDKRITTHCALASRAFGADAIVYSGMKDAKLEATIKKTCEKFGNHFSIAYEKDAIAYIKKKKAAGFLIIHLTVYGLPYQENLKNIANKNLLIVIGSEKVPPEVYNLADYNLAITQQPHSEVSSLAVFLHDFFDKKELKKKFKDAKINIIPQARGKLVQ